VFAILGIQEIFMWPTLFFI